ncbi:hypothetical protein RB195_010578 [Necator americanus]|uniref:Uncharacterized protein n=1 Tax=Necator americanus TaxID=51031 RepID=A0ABR1CYK0_NECAM
MVEEEALLQCFSQPIYLAELLLQKAIRALAQRSHFLDRKFHHELSVRKTAQFCAGMILRTLNVTKLMHISFKFFNLSGF